jgi:hypothetical protein
MSETYVSGGQDPTAAGRLILIISSSLAAVLVIAGLFYAAGTGARTAAGLAAAGCEPGLAPPGVDCTTAPMLSKHFRSVVSSASQQLDVAVVAYTANEAHQLAPAEAALQAEMTAEQAFGRNLAAIKFPVAIAPAVAALIKDNQARAVLTAGQAKSASLAKLRAFDKRVQAASSTVESDIQAVNKAIAAPLPAA